MYLIPGKCFRNLTHRPKFVRKERSRKEKADAPIIAPAPQRLFESGHIGPGLLAHIAINKYLYQLPLYRQEKMFFQQSGVRIPRQTMCDGLDRLTFALTPICNAAHKVLLESRYIQVDETSVKFIDSEEKHGATKTGYLGIANNPDGEVLYFWNTGRDTSCVEKILGENSRRKLRRHFTKRRLLCLRILHKETYRRHLAKLLGACPARIFRRAREFSSRSRTGLGVKPKKSR